MNIRVSMCSYVFAALALFVCTPVIAQETRPKVVSLDYCSDQFVLALADRHVKAFHK